MHTHEAHVFVVTYDQVICFLIYIKANSYLNRLKYCIEPIEEYMFKQLS